MKKYFMPLSLSSAGKPVVAGFLGRVANILNKQNAFLIKDYSTEGLLCLFDMYTFRN